ncbi:hypothetical protein [Dictyobacter formicarum]|uniref:hypothetical protein n=1 Tax=Dictyobacter formicarum TaxID=2778368 RepID=UPI0019157F4A|nr:hypothetical protein [Dictyobacter formicarum]
MSRSDISSQSGLLLHACCLTNLVASEYLDEILEILPPVSISQDMYWQEPLFFDDHPEAPSKERIRITPDRFPKMLSLLPLPPGLLGEVIDLAVVLGGDCEGYTAALALHHRWAVGMDTPKTIALFEHHASALPIISTPALIKYWMECASPSAQKVTQAIKNISARARYLPQRTHPLSSWWKSYLNP